MQDPLFHVGRVFTATTSFTDLCGWCQKPCAPVTGGCTPLPGHNKPVWYGICATCAHRHGTPKPGDTITIKETP